MTVLWISFAIYIFGIATILVLRPAFMFHSDGSAWKEFGLSSNGTYTVFPFWMFAIVWALASYAIATVVMLFLATISLRSTPEYSQNIHLKPISSQNTTPPGYYMLESNATESPKYVFFGAEPPHM